jgi:hypothetical protein
MRFTNDLLLFVTFIASVTLLAVMYQRGLIRRLLLFSVLLMFYVLRAAVLIIGVKIFDRGTYLQVASFASLVDLGLQLALAYTLARRLKPLRRSAQKAAAPRPWNSPWFLFASGLLVAGALTFAVALVSSLPGRSPVPLDRGVIFGGFVFLFLLVAFERSENTAERRLLSGFCIVSAANILSQCGRSLAAGQHDARLFLAWAYGNTVVWVAVLVFWILRLQASPSGIEVAGGTTVTLEAMRMEGEQEELAAE